MTSARTIPRWPGLALALVAHLAPSTVYAGPPTIHPAPPPTGTAPQPAPSLPPAAPVEGPAPGEPPPSPAPPSPAPPSPAPPSPALPASGDPASGDPAKPSGAAAPSPSAGSSPSAQAPSPDAPLPLLEMVAPPAPSVVTLPPPHLVGATEPSPPRGSSMRTAGWIALGLGGASTIAGAVLATQVLRVNDALVDACRDDDVYHCGASQESNIQSLLAYRVSSVATLGLGAAGLVTGTILLIAAPHDGDRTTTLTAGLDGLHLGGTFQ